MAVTGSSVYVSYHWVDLYGCGWAGYCYQDMGYGEVLEDKISAEYQAVLWRDLLN